MPKDENNQHSIYDDKRFKKFKKQSLEEIKQEYFRCMIGQYKYEGKKIDEKTMLKANKEAYIYTQNIYRGPYKNLLSYQSKEKGNMKNPIDENLWDKAEDIYENQKKKTIEFFARIGLVALVGGAAAIGLSRTKKLSAPSNDIRVEEQQDQGKDSSNEKQQDMQNKSDIQDKETNTGKTEKSSKDEFIDGIKVDENSSEEDIDKANEELESNREFRDNSENRKFYMELIDEYNARTPKEYAKIRQKDTRIVELDGKRYVNYGFRHSGELVYVDDMFIKDDALKQNQLQVADKFPENYVYVLDTVNQRVIAATASLNGQAVNVVSNYYQGASRTVYINPFGDDIENALIISDVLDKDRTLFQAARDGCTEEERAVEALRWMKADMDRAEKLEQQEEYSR